MNQNDIKDKVIKAEAKVVKCKSVLKKHQDRLIKLIQSNADEVDIAIKQDEIKSAQRKVKDAENILNNWKEKLNERITADDYIEANTPEVLKNFLENWKQHAMSYYKDKYVRFVQYRKELRVQEMAARLEAFRTLPSLQRFRDMYHEDELTDYVLDNLYPYKDVDKFLEERGLGYFQKQKKLKDFGDRIIFKMDEIRNEQEREMWLDKTIEEEKGAKLLDLIGRIMGVVGTITDVSALTIGADGDINGYIVGTEGKAKIQTIGAGGYNIQCFHFRTLITEYQ